MSLFSSHRHYALTVADLLPVAAEVAVHFKVRGYEVRTEPTLTGGWFLSLSKGDTFKLVLGQRTALNVGIEPMARGTMANTSVGIFGLQAVPAMIGMFVFWPVLLVQLWGLVQQHELDREALDVVGQALQRHLAPLILSASEAPRRLNEATVRFCARCGVALPTAARYCPACGADCRAGAPPVG